MGKIITPVGKIIVRVNEEEQQYEYRSLPLEGKCFKVDHRYIVSIPLTQQPVLSISCLLMNDRSIYLEKVIETGERLALVSYFHNDYKLSLSTIGDRICWKYCYMDNGLNVLLPGALCKKMYFVLAGKRLLDQDDGINTWLAADAESVLKDELKLSDY